MNKISRLFSSELKVINIGIDKFQKDLASQGVEVIQLDWKPPAGGNMELISAIDKLLNNPLVRKANQETVKRIKQAQPVLVDIDKAINAIPAMTDKTILHSGPPVKWENMAGPMRGAIIGALIYEGKAANEEEASKLASAGEIEFAPCHHYNAVGPMAGIISPSMPVFVVQNKTAGNLAYCTINEGLGKVLRYGAFNEEVIKRLKWIEQEFAPVLKKALKETAGIDLKSIIAQAIQMGDECHNRNRAATSLFFKEISLLILEAEVDVAVTRRALQFIKENDHFFLNLSMSACKASLDAGHGVKGSTIVTAMARNGVEFGIKVSGLGEKEWFLGPANMVKGLIFPGFTGDDASYDIGDSAITETIGIGGFAMGGAPAIVQFVGGSVEDALNYSRQMYEITESENTNYSIPSLDFRGTAIGIDVVKVIHTGILPIINTGIAHKKAGIGQIGAGLVHPPKECFEKALIALAQKIE